MTGAAKRQQRRSITAKELARRLGSSERTARRLVAEPRDEFIARGHARRKKAAELRKQGLKYKDIAEELDCTIGAVGALIYEARKHGDLPAKNADTSAKKAS